MKQDQPVSSNGESVSEADIGARLAAANLALRRRAEFFLQEKVLREMRSENERGFPPVPLLSTEAMGQKLYELQVHQIELQMQNEELRRTQLELDATRARYFDLYDLAPVGYCTVNAAGQIVEANLTAAGLLGVSRQGLVGKPFSRFLASSAQDTFYLQRNKLLNDHLPVSFDVCMQKANQELFWALVSGTAEKMGDQTIQLRWVLVDISERRAAEAVIQLQQARYRNLFVAMDEGFCIIEVIFDAEQNPVDYRFIEVNPAFEKHTGLSEATGKRIREMVPNIEGFWLNLYGNVSLTGQAVKTVHEASSMGRWFEVHASIHGALPSRKVAVIFNDVTERKQSEIRSAQLDQVLQEKNTAMERAMAIAEKASQAKSAFLSSMSHELRTPLNAILGFAQMLEIGMPPPTPLQKRNVDQILKAGWYLLELINEVLDLSMVESGKLKLSREPVGLADLLLECRAMIEPQAQRRGVSLHFPRLERGSFVSADRTRFKQVLLNLLLNAIKYNRPNGSVVVECVLKSADILRIGVRDTGSGMAPEQMAHLFQPFNRLGKETGVEEGTGIGLIVTKRLVELMGGTIGVESKVDEGSFFWVELHVSSGPQFAVREMHLPEHVESVAQVGAALRTLLYVEDNPANLELVEQLVAMRNDVRLISATDGSVGIGFARNLQPDVILMDINLPGISGVQALQILQADASTKHIPVIALSANAMASDIEQGLQLGFYHYLTKPIRVREFMQTLDSALAFAARTAADEHLGKG